jgi:hypothetical protein
MKGLGVVPENTGLAPADRGCHAWRGHGQRGAAVAFAGWRQAFRTPYNMRRQ